MRFDYSQMIDGHELKAVRRYLRADDCYDAQSAAVFLKLTAEEGALFIEALSDDGYIKKDSPTRFLDGSVSYGPTDLGIRLCKAKLFKRILRKKADVIVAAMLQEVRRINEDPNLITWIDEIDLFGSYAEGADEVGDIDIAIQMSHRLPEELWMKASARRASETGTNMSFLRRITWGDNEVIQRIKKISRYIDFEYKSNCTWTATSLFTRELPNSASRSRRKYFFKL